MTELIDDVFAVIESSRLPLVMSDIIQDVAVLPVGRGEPMWRVKPTAIAAEVERLIKQGKVESGTADGGSELVYRLKQDKKRPNTQKDLF